MTDTLITRLEDPCTWQEFLAARVAGGHLTSHEEKNLRAFVEDRGWEAVMARLAAGEGFSVPVRKLLAKRGSAKKRAVFIFPRDEMHVLKLLGHELAKRYDDAFAPNLYSFRPHRGVTRAMADILRTPDIGGMWTYKADISDYFNSIDVARLVAQLRSLMADEPAAFELLRGLLECPVSIDGATGEEICVPKGAMAGMPVAVFLANLHLCPLDREFADRTDVVYARYSDDIIVFARSEQARDEAAARIAEALAGLGLSINPSKEVRTSPGERWTFLGIGYEDGTVDISPASQAKMLAKIRRRARAIERWRVRKGATRENAVTAFIRAMNRKFFAADDAHELTWTRWYFPLITTDATLRRIDAHMQHWIRWLATGSHAKQSFRYRYESMKERGYVSQIGRASCRERV